MKKKPNKSINYLAFFIVQLSHPYMTTGKTIALTRQTSVGKVMSLLFNMLSRLVIISLPSGKRLLISWLQSPSAVILEPQKIKSDTVSTVSPSNTMAFCHKGGKICISKVTDISPSNLDSSFCFIQASVSHDILCK